MHIILIGTGNKYILLGDVGQAADGSIVFADLVDGLGVDIEDFYGPVHAADVQGGAICIPACCHWDCVEGCHHFLEDAILGYFEYSEGFVPECCGEDWHG